MKFAAVFCFDKTAEKNIHCEKWLIVINLYNSHEHPEGWKFSDVLK